MPPGSSCSTSYSSTAIKSSPVLIRALVYAGAVVSLSLSIDRHCKPPTEISRWTNSSDQTRLDQTRPVPFLSCRLHRHSALLPRLAQQGAVDLADISRGRRDNGFSRYNHNNSSNTVSKQEATMNGMALGWLEEGMQFYLRLLKVFGRSLPRECALQ